MPDTKDLGRIYVTRMRYLHKKRLSFLERGSTVEIEHPYRRGRSIVVRIPFTTLGIVLGWWGQPGDELENLMEAVGARLIGPITSWTTWDPHEEPVQEADGRERPAEHPQAADPNVRCGSVQPD